MGSENRPPELSPETAADLNFFGGFPPVIPLDDFKDFAESSLSAWRNNLEPDGLEPRAIKSPACGTETKINASTGLATG